MLRRRTILIAIVSIVIGGKNSNGATVSLLDLAALGKALGDAADAIGKLGDNIAHLVSLSFKGWDAASARITRNRLQEISAKLTILATVQNGPAIESLDDYIKQAKIGLRPDLLEELWGKMLKRFSEVLLSVRNLLNDLQKERSDLVNEDMYKDLLEILQGRVTILETLSQSDAPVSAAAIKSLSLTAANYKKLKEALLKTTHIMNDYIKTLG